MKILRRETKFVVFLSWVLSVKTVCAQNVGISSSSSFTPDASAGLDISYTSKGLLIPRVALTASNAAGPIASPATSLLVYNTATAGTSPNNVIPGYYYWNGSIWTGLTTNAQTSNLSWSTTGNASTTAGTNFLGTTDANDLVFKTSSTERMRIVDAANATTGTSGDIVVGNANSGTLRAAKEIVLRQDGDTYGPSTIRLRNRNGQNGAVFETTGGTANLVDFVFNTGPVAAPISSNIRFETRSGSMKVAGNTTEWQIGQPDVVNGGPTLIVGASGNGSNSAIRTGNFAVGNTAFNGTYPEKLLVDAGTTSSYNVISGRGNLNNYLQLNIQNNNAGTAASSDVVATADNGNETTNYIDMGINSSANTAAYFGGINDAYLYNAGGTASGGNLFIGTSTSAKVLGFMTGGGAAANERMRIDGTGNVGIGTTTPATKLHVFGANPLTLSGVVTGTSTTADSLLTITNGLVRKLPVATFASTGNDWSTTGNAGTVSATNFLGTTDNKPLRFRTNNAQRLLLDSLGNVAIGLAPIFTASPNAERLLVDAGSTSANPSTSYNVINGKGYLDNYLQLNIQNMAPTAAASSDIVATADNGSETANFIDMGINSSGNTSTGAIGGASTAYLYSTGNDFAIGNGTANKSVVFFTGGLTPATYTERFRLDANGRVGIGTKTPASDLAVFQSSGTGSGKGITFAGNSVGNTSSGTGFLMTLGYNTNGNKQLWLGDPDYATNSAGSFLRVAIGGTTFPTLDAVAGDNSTRRYIGLGTGGDPSAGIIFGNDANGTSPSSFVWDNGNMAIGNGYRGNAAPGNGLIVQGNVGIATTTPNSTLDVNGSTGAAITTTSASITLGATNYTVILTSGTPTVTLPAAASTNARRMYVIVNETAAAITISSYIAFTGSAATTIAANSSITIQSNGTNWYRIQ